MRSSPLVALTLAVGSAFGIGAAHAEGEGRIPTVELEKLLAGTDDLARTVSELRGLPIKQPIARGVTSMRAAWSSDPSTVSSDVESRST